MFDPKKERVRLQKRRLKNPNNVLQSTRKNFYAYW